MQAYVALVLDTSLTVIVTTNMLYNHLFTSVISPLQIYFGNAAYIYHPKTTANFLTVRVAMTMRLSYYIGVFGLFTHGISNDKQ